MSRPVRRSKSGKTPQPGSMTSRRTTSTLDSAQLDNIKTQLDLVLLALESIAGIGSEAMLKAARELGVESMVSDRVSLWRLRQSNPLRKGSGGRKKLDVEEARSLVLVSCYLARSHHGKIRQAVELLERVTQAEQPPHHTPVLGDYLDRFSNTYQDRMAVEQTSADELAHLAFKLLIDLLFYSGLQGPQRLWMLLLDCSRKPESDRSAPASRPSSEESKPALNQSANQKKSSTKMKRPPSALDESIG